MRLQPVSIAFTATLLWGCSGDGSHRAAHSGDDAGARSDAGGEGADAGSDAGTTSPRVTVSVDSNLKPDRATIAGIGDGPDRRIATLTDHTGITTDFVENELIVTAHAEADLAPLLKAHQGTVLQSFVPAPRFTKLDSYFLVHVDTTGVDVSSLPRQLTKLEPRVKGDLVVSSSSAEQLVAVAAEAGIGGLAVSLNYLPKSTSLADGHPLEGATGGKLTYSDGARKDISEDYVSDVSQWSYMRVGGASMENDTIGPQDIGVVEAWKALAAAGKLGNKTLIAVLDGGLVDNRDIPQGAIWLTPPGAPNAASCPNASGGSTPCPWHGTGTVAALMGVPDNGFGAAGPAGPVAIPLLVPSPDDFWTGIKYVLVDLPAVTLLQPRILNLSFSIRIPEVANWGLNLVVDPIFSALRLAGTLVFAAAGNNQADVDETDDEGIFKVASWLPCQSSDVICVGALTLQTNVRALAYSNWANTSEKIDHTNTVDIYAPGNIWRPNVSDSGQALDDVVQDQGTSVASPFVAGVAALIWASDPNLSAGDVESILMSTAHTGSPDGLVPRWVNALGAVKSVLGNIPPSVQITVPTAADASQEVPGDLPGVDFTAVTSDYEDGPLCCNLEWTSSNGADGMSGVLAYGPKIHYAFTTVGSRTITVTAQDSQGATSTASIAVTVTAPQLTASITSPLPGATIYVGAATQLTGSLGMGGFDGCVTHGGGTHWSSSVAADSLSATGCVQDFVFQSAGPRTLSFDYQDMYGVSSHASVMIDVVQPTTPVVSSLSFVMDGKTRPVPISNTTTVDYMMDVQTFQVVGVAAGGAPPLAYRWTWQDTESSGCPETAIGTGTTVSWTWGQPDKNNPQCRDRTGRLTFYVTDAANQTVSARTAATFTPPLP